MTFLVVLLFLFYASGFPLFEKCGHPFLIRSFLSP
jgi:hypothetical protein